MNIIKYSIECWIFDQNYQYVLLLKCPKTDHHDEYWQPVTGGINTGEDPMLACIREVNEETGICLTKNHIQMLLDDYTFCRPKEKIELRKCIFLTQVKNHSVTISDEHIDYKWVTPDTVNQYLLWESNKETFKVVYQYTRNIITRLSK